MSNANKQRKAVYAARLAISSASLGVSNRHEAVTAGNTAGRLAYSAGITLSDLESAVGTSLCSSDAWPWIVDGWYDAKEATEVQEADVTAALEVIKQGGQASTMDRQKAYATVEKMWDLIKAGR